MQRIVLCTSSSGLDNMEKPSNIRMMRIHMEFYGEHYQDGLDIGFQDIANVMMADKDLLPVTYAPSVEEILLMLESFYAEGINEVFAVTISSKMSKSYENLMKAKELFDKDMFIHIFDTKTVSYSEAIIGLEAARMINEGINSVEIAKRLDALRENNSLWIAIADVRNLIKTGRLSAPAGFIANMLNIKPVLAIDEDGAVYSQHKVRRLNKALEVMCNEAVANLEERPGELYIVSLGNDALVEKVTMLLAERGVINPTIYPTASAAIAVHGPQGAGIGINHDC